MPIPLVRIPCGRTRREGEHNVSTTRRGKSLGIHLVVLLSVAVLVPSVATAAGAATTASFATPAPGLSGGQVVVDGAGQAYATNRSQNRVEVLSLTTHALEAPIAVGSSPVSLDLSPDRTTLYVANYDSNDVSVVDLSLRREVRRIAMPDPGHPSSIAVAANGTALLARAAAGGSSDAPTLAQIDLSSGAVRARTDWLPYTLSLDTVRVQASGDRSRIGIVRSLGSGSFYDTETDGFTAEKVLGSGGFLAVDNAGSKLITGGPDTLVLDRDLVLRATIPGPGTIALALNGAGTVGYRLRGTQVDVLDLSRALVTASIALPDPPSQYAGSLALTPDGSTLVALTANGFSVVPTSAATPVPCVAPAAPAQVLPVCGAPLADMVADGRGRAYVSNPTRNQVEVVSLGSRSLEAPIAVGSQPGSLDLSPDGNTLYVVDTGGQDVSVVDLSARREVRRITVPFAKSTERLFSIAVADNGTALLTTRSPADGLGQRLVQIVLATGTVTERTDIPVAKPLYLEASGDHRRIAALVGDAPGGMLFEYVAGKDTFTPPKFVSAGLSEIAMDGDGSELLVGPGNYDYDPGVYRLDRDLVRRGTIDPFGDGLAISPSGTTAYTVFGHTLGIIDVQRNLTVRWVPLPEGLASKPGALVPTPDGGAVAVVTTSGIAFASTTAGYAVPACGSAYVAGQVTAVCGGLSDVVTDRTGHAYVSNPERNEIEVVSLADGTPEVPIPVGSRPRGLDLSADGTKLYVADSGPRRSRSSTCRCAGRRTGSPFLPPPTTTGRSRSRWRATGPPCSRRRSAAPGTAARSASSTWPTRPLRCGRTSAWPVERPAKRPSCGRAATDPTSRSSKTISPTARSPCTRPPPTASRRSRSARSTSPPSPWTPRAPPSSSTLARTCWTGRRSRRASSPPEARASP